MTWMPGRLSKPRAYLEPVPKVGFFLIFRSLANIHRLCVNTPQAKASSRRSNLLARIGRPRKRHPEVAEGIVVVALNDEIAPGRSALALLGNQVQGNEVLIEGFVPLDLGGFPHEAKPSGVAPVPGLQQANKFFAVKVVVS